MNKIHFPSLFIKSENYINLILIVETISSQTWPEHIQIKLRVTLFSNNLQFAQQQAFKTRRNHSNL